MSAQPESTITDPKADLIAGLEEMLLPRFVMPGADDDDTQLEGV